MIESTLLKPDLSEVRRLELQLAEELARVRAEQARQMQQCIGQTFVELEVRDHTGWHTVTDLREELSTGVLGVLGYDLHVRRLRGLSPDGRLVCESLHISSDFSDGDLQGVFQLNSHRKFSELKGRQVDPVLIAYLFAEAGSLLQHGPNRLLHLVRIIREFADMIPESDSHSCAEETAQ